MKTQHLKRTYLCLLLVVHCFLVAYLNCKQSPNGNEPGHLAAGLYGWTLGTTELYKVNPPLVRTIATAPIVLLGFEALDLPIRLEAAERIEYWLAFQLLKHNEDIGWGMFVIARLAVLPFSLLAMTICYAWASELYGGASGLIAAHAWCFSPTVLANASTICPDIAASAMCVAACYAFARWQREETWSRATMAGIVLGLGLLTKFTLLILLPVYLVMLLYAGWKRSASWYRKVLPQFSVMLAAVLFVLQMGYGFEYPTTNLASENLQSEFFNQMASLFGGVSLPIPRDVVLGLDLQHSDFESGRYSFLLGEWKLGGWWWYYFACLAVKVPLGYLLLVAWLVVRLVLNPKVHAWKRGELAIVLPCVTIFCVVSSQTGFNWFLRYLLPAWPFACIWMGRAALHRSFKVAIVCLTWATLSSLMVYPYCGSYFNEITGPSRGFKVLRHANVDWGQNYGYLSEWLRNQEVSETIYVDPEYELNTWLCGIESAGAPSLEKSGIHVMSVNRLYSRDGEYAEFRDRKPIHIVGYSIYLFEVD